MMRRTVIALIATLAVAGNLMAQERQGAQPKEPTRQSQQGAKNAPMTPRQLQLQNMAQHTEQLAVRIRETNQWMEQKQVREEYRQLGRNLEQSCDQLHQMIRQNQQLRSQIQDVKQDRARVQQLDKLQDRLRDMDRNMTQAHEALRKMVGMA